MTPVTCKETTSPDFPLGHGAVPRGQHPAPTSPGTMWGPVFPGLWLVLALSLLSEIFAFSLVPWAESWNSRGTGSLP